MSHVESTESDKVNSTHETNGDHHRSKISIENEFQSSIEQTSTDQPDGNRVNKKKKRNKSTKINPAEQLNGKHYQDKSDEGQVNNQTNGQVNGEVNNQTNGQVNGEVNNQIADTQSTDKQQSIDKVDIDKSSDTAEVQDKQSNDTEIDNNQENNKMNIDIEHKPEDNVNILIDSPNKIISVHHDTSTTDENTNLLEQSKKKDDSEQSDTKLTSIESKRPELLLTENNLTNNGNKLIIAAILIFKFFTYFIIKIIALFHPSKRNQLPPINEPLLLLSASEITERIKNGQLKCEHIISAYINRIESVQPKLNAMVDNCFEEAIAKAKEIDEQLKDPRLAAKLKKLPLLGVPFTCKDSISVKGLVLTAGVLIRKGIKAEEDSTVIKNLREAGAIPLGITNTPELVLWCDSDNNLYGRTNNPYDLSRIVGGSSGGEGCLIAAAGSLIGVGSDVAGSIRIPSMFCGTFGHKTTLKYVPVDGMFPKPPEAYKSFLCYGPICRYARDLPLALKVFGGEATNELRLDEPVDLKKMKIYYMEHDGGNPLTSFVDQRIINCMHRVIKYFKEEYGIEAEQININKFKYSLAFFGTVCVKGEMKIEDYVSRTGHLNVYWELFKSLFGKSDITRPILIQIINQNSPYCDANSASYKKFTEMLASLKPKVHELLGDNAVLMLPTWPTVAPKHKTTILRGFDATYVAIMNSMEIPATHCTVGLTKEEGLPIGFSVAAAPGRDRISIAFAQEIERRFGGWVPPQSQ